MGWPTIHTGPDLQAEARPGRRKNSTGDIAPRPLPMARGSGSLHLHGIRSSCFRGGTELSVFGHHRVFWWLLGVPGDFPPGRRGLPTLVGKQAGAPRARRLCGRPSPTRSPCGKCSSRGSGTSGFEMGHGGGRCQSENAAKARTRRWLVFEKAARAQRERKIQNDGVGFGDAEIVHHFTARNARHRTVQKSRVRYARPRSGMGRWHDGIMHKRGKERAMVKDQLSGVWVDSRMARGPFSQRPEQPRATKPGSFDAIRWLAFGMSAIVPANRLQAGQVDSHGRAAFACRQRAPIVKQNGRIGYADPLDGPRAAWQLRQDHQQDGP